MNLNLFKKGFKRNIKQTPQSLIEEIERIRLNVEFSSFENKCKTLIFTSPSYKEGKTTIVTHLAAALAENGQTVLLIDTDIKKPTLHKVFKIKNTMGLTNILTGQKTFEETVNQTNIGRLRVLTAGPIPYSTEKIFKSITLDQLLEGISSSFDYILIDSAPALKGNDTRIFASKCDGVILVVKNGKTENSLALEAKKALEIAKANLLGVILNAKPRGLLNKFF
ncbi:capsular exopolysaccharide synthesis family protein [Bacillus tianshenii]|uniref:non-specific protein-tyrosine kinase n=1 Tax=Sutcliffiella tianshenii TaxID=1463404 RepID=A0ABS2NUF1_9BACI|nr:capsular exopolysaccharide synthesis family protein [Bacillus tianshenii]